MPYAPPSVVLTVTSSASSTEASLTSTTIQSATGLDTRRRGTPGGANDSALQNALRPPARGGHYLVGFVRWRLAQCTCRTAPQGWFRKPAYEELMKLIKGEWWLKPATLCTGNNGEIQFNGFLGEYELTCCGQQESFFLARDQDLTITKRDWHE